MRILWEAQSRLHQRNANATSGYSFRNIFKLGLSNAIPVNPCDAIRKQVVDEEALTCS